MHMMSNVYYVRACLRVCDCVHFCLCVDACDLNSEAKMVPCPMCILCVHVCVFARKYV